MSCSTTQRLHIANTISSFAVFFSRVPWLGPYVGYIPGAGRALGALQSRCREFTMQRIQRGSNSRDLFHYLVSTQLCLAYSDAHLPLCVTLTEQRRPT